MPVLWPMVITLCFVGLLVAYQSPTRLVRFRLQSSLGRNHTLWLCDVRTIRSPAVVRLITGDGLDDLAGMRILWYNTGRLAHVNRVPIRLRRM